MASGRISSSVIQTADTFVKVCTIPAGAVTTININCVNKGTTDVGVSILISTSDTPSESDYIEYMATIPSHGVLERTGVACSPEERVFVKVTTANTVAVRIFGFQ